VREGIQNTAQKKMVINIQRELMGRKRRMEEALS
jgi:hypothetical protein